MFFRKNVSRATASGADDVWGNSCHAADGLACFASVAADGEGIKVTLSAAGLFRQGHDSLARFTSQSQRIDTDSEIFVCSHNGTVNTVVVGCGRAQRLALLSEYHASLGSVYAGDDIRRGIFARRQLQFFKTDACLSVVADFYVGDVCPYEGILPSDAAVSVETDGQHGMKTSCQPLHGFHACALLQLGQRAAVFDVLSFASHDVLAVCLVAGHITDGLAEIAENAGFEYCHVCVV